jgi:hypothetical protein
VHPYLEITELNKTNVLKGTLADFLGLPVLANGDSISAPYQVSALPFRAYQLIYNEYYRDQNLIDPVTVLKTDGLDGSADVWQLRKRAWEKDYFTSCLPWAQKGGPVTAPAEVEYSSLSQVRTATDTIPADAGLLSTSGNLQAGAGVGAKIENIEDIGININDLRISVRLQEWLERQARAGSRYIETILSNWGVLSSDARLQRPEYLGGSINPIVISEVLSTYQNADDTGYPQGNMSGHGISTGGNGGFKRKFEEHGYVFGIMTVLPRTAYQQGIPKTFSRFDKFDYAWPSFAQLGEQEVKTKELFFAPNNESANETVFGYQSRYAEYKYQPSTVHGDFKDTLDYWHMGRKFAAVPVLNASFIEADPTKRIFAVTDQNEDEILCQIYNRVDAIRCLPYFNTPTL